MHDVVIVGGGPGGSAAAHFLSRRGLDVLRVSADAVRHNASINALHNLYNYDLDSAFREIERVSRGARYICVEAYRNEREKVNLMYWQLTCRAFHTPEEWDFVFGQAGYTGDHEFIFFE